MKNPICTCGQDYKSHDENGECAVSHCEGYEPAMSIKVYLFSTTTAQQYAELEKMLMDSPIVKTFELVRR